MQTCQHLSCIRCLVMHGTRVPMLSNYGLLYASKIEVEAIHQCTYLLPLTKIFVITAFSVAWL